MWRSCEIGCASASATTSSGTVAIREPRSVPARVVLRRQRLLWPAGARPPGDGHLQSACRDHDDRQQAQQRGERAVVVAAEQAPRGEQEDVGRDDRRGRGGGEQCAASHAATGCGRQHRSILGERADLQPVRSRGMTVDVVIPVHDGWALTQRCIQLLEAQTLAHQVIVFDNGSTDGTPRAFEGVLPGRASARAGDEPRLSRRVQPRRRRRGSDVVVLLNNDVECRPDFLERLIAPLARRQTARFVAALLLAPGEAAHRELRLGGRPDDRGLSPPSRPPADAQWHATRRSWSARRVLRAPTAATPGRASAGWTRASSRTRRMSTWRCGCGQQAGRARRPWLTPSPCTSARRALRRARLVAALPGRVRARLLPTALRRAERTLRGARAGDRGDGHRRRRRRVLARSRRASRPGRGLARRGRAPARRAPAR